ncbi:MAG: cyclic nucleotide-binding domain-containing protein, partial [Bacteroidota bacterium]
MAEQLLEHIGKRIALGPELAAAVSERFEVEELKKGAELLREGQTCRKLYFIQAGTVRTYYNQDGKDVTAWFYPEGQFVTSWYSFLNGMPGYEYIQALETTTLL